MENEELRGRQINRMQTNLCALRKMAGWSTEQLASKLDVSKQTISNLENKEDHTKMKYAQYVALKSIFDDEVAANPDNELLKKAVEILLNEPDVEEEQYKKSEVVMGTLAAAKASGANTSDILDFLKIVGGAVATAAVAAGGALSIGVIIDEILKGSKDK